MNDSKNSSTRAAANWMWRRALWVIFALVLLIPKVNRVRRRSVLWNSGRALIAVAGVAVLIAGATRGFHAGPVVAAGIMLAFALLASPERQGIAIEARRRELGALVVVDGGHYGDATRKRHRVRLFIAGDRLLVVDASLRMLLELPYRKIRTQSVQASGSGWGLRIEYDNRHAEFAYQGVFAEHFARVAAATIQSRLQRELPVLH